MKHNYSANYKDVRLRPLEEKDIERLRIWRNDPAQTAFLRRINEITPQMQREWFRSYLNNPDEFTFAIEETRDLQRMVGSISLYNFKGDTAEAGRLQIGDSYAHGRGIARKSMVLLSNIGFKKFGLKRIIASVHRDNIAAYKSYMDIGFQVVGCHAASMGGIEDEIEINQKILEEVNDSVEKIIILGN